MNILKKVIRVLTTFSIWLVSLMPPQTIALPKGFVYLHDLNPDITIDIRYAGSDNFLGRPVKGYHKNVAILTREAAMAVCEVEKALNKQGYTLIIYDAYRPEKAVAHFVEWSADSDEAAKLAFYPRVNKADFFDLGYVAKTHSSHSRGSTVDLSIKRLDAPYHQPTPELRHLPDATRTPFLYLEDGSMDMGVAFDFFDELSWPSSALISEEAKKNRAILQNVMQAHGFLSFRTEWWHFTLENEPFPDTYFDFDVE